MQSVLRWLLLARVHWDAFIRAPRAYCVAAKWRLLGKKVRARGHFAPLLSASPRAYLLWIQCIEGAGQPASPPDAARPILAVIDGRSGVVEDVSVEATLASLAAENLPVAVIGSADLPSPAALAARMAPGTRTWLLPIMPGDRIACGAAATYRGAMTGEPDGIIYADDDALDHKGWRHAPHFKPQWNTPLFAHFDFMTGACIVAATPDDLTAAGDAPGWAERLVARVAQSGPPPRHVAQVLHHRHRRPAPRVPAAPLALAAELPPVSVVIPTRNRVDLLRTCLDGLAAADYPDVEAIIVDNGSDDPETLSYLAALPAGRYKVIRDDGPFNFSALNNRAVAGARGHLLCLLNNDVEMIDRNWLATMATSALRDDVGAVGARLLYPDGRVQHAGVVIGVGNAAGHAHRFLRPDEEGYFHRHSLPHFVSAVTAACLVVARERFLAVGGLDETRYAVAFNDVDLCLRLNQRGWQSFYDPRATLIHHESVSRGFDRDPVGAARFAGELAALKAQWRTDEVVDPWHHPQLSRASERFAVAVPMN